MRGAPGWRPPPLRRGGERGAWAGAGKRCQPRRRPGVLQIVSDGSSSSLGHGARPPAARCPDPVVPWSFAPCPEPSRRPWPPACCWAPLPCSGPATPFRAPARMSRPSVMRSPAAPTASGSRPPTAPQWARRPRRRLPTRTRCALAQVPPDLGPDIGTGNPRRTEAYSPAQGCGFRPLPTSAHAVVHMDEPRRGVSGHMVPCRPTIAAFHAARDAGHPNPRAADRSSRTLPRRIHSPARRPSGPATGRIRTTACSTTTTARTSPGAARP